MAQFMHYKRLSRVTELLDKNGERVPFKMLYAAKCGDIISPESGEAVVTSVDVKNGCRTVKFLASGNSRTLCDCLFLSVFLNGTEFLITAN